MLKFKHITKSFPGVKALDDVTIEIGKGEVVALIGENGAGKSTLIKILSGAYRRDSGEIILDGNELPMQYSTLEARNFGIATIYQELSLMGELSVMQNIYIAHEPRLVGSFIDFKKMYENTKNLLRKLNAITIDPKGRVGDLTPPTKQLVEIAKALALDCKVIVMDEPTTSLTDDESRQLFSIIDSLRKQEITVIYISHRLNEVFQICDSVIVLRDGKLAGTKKIANCTSDEIIELMSGHSLVGNSVKDRKIIDKKNATPILELEHITDGGFITDLSLTLFEGEVLGIGGLVGSKRTELMRMVCGVDSRKGGTIKVHGKRVNIRNTSDAIKCGLGYLSESRQEDGLSLGLSIEENTIHCDMKSVSSYGLINWKEVRRLSDGFINMLRTKGKSPTKVLNLSGGNQQKVAIAKWFHAGCDILIFDEPTRGIDVSAKAEIHRLIRDFAAQTGHAAIVISSEANELVSVCDRILIMSKGQIVGELEGEDIAQNNVLQYITSTKGR